MYICIYTNSLVVLGFYFIPVSQFYLHKSQVRPDLLSPRKRKQSINFFLLKKTIKPRKLKVVMCLLVAFFLVTLSTWGWLGSPFYLFSSCAVVLLKCSDLYWDFLTVLVTCCFVIEVTITISLDIVENLICK